MTTKDKKQVEEWIENVKWANYYSNGKFINTLKILEEIKNK